MGSVFNNKSVVRAFAVVCSLSLGLPQAYAVNPALGDSVPGQIEDPLVMLTCPVAAVLGEDATLPKSKDQNNKATGFLFGAAGVSVVLAGLVLRASDEHTLRSNRQTLKLLREFVAADDALRAAESRLQAVHRELGQFIDQHNLNARIVELRRTSLAQTGTASVDPKDLFAGTNVTELQQSRYGQLNIERATLTVQTHGGKDTKVPVLKRRVFEALKNLKEKTTIVHHPGDSSHYRVAQEKIKEYSKRVETTEDIAKKIAPKRNLLVGSGLLLVIGGVALFYYGDEVAEFFGNKESMSQQEANALAATARCLVNGLDQKEAIVEKVPPEAEPDLNRVYDDLKQSGVLQ